jgi:hypothetical protein
MLLGLGLNIMRIGVEYYEESANLMIGAGPLPQLRVGISVPIHAERSR